MIFWSLPIPVFIFLLIYAFFEKVQDKWDHREEDRSYKAFNLYVKMAFYSPEKQAAILNKKSPATRRLFRDACNRWDESGHEYEDMEKALQQIRKVQRLRKIARVRSVWNRLRPAT